MLLFIKWLNVDLGTYKCSAKWFIRHSSNFSPNLEERQFNYISDKCINQKYYQQTLLLSLPPCHGLGPCPLHVVARPLLGAAATSVKVTTWLSFPQAPREIASLSQCQPNHIRCNRQHSRNKNILSFLMGLSFKFVN